jgi:alkaline phosphatase/alkaline phosphatase D
MNKLLVWGLTVLICSACNASKTDQAPLKVDHRILLSTGELSHQSIIIQCRFNQTDTLVNLDLDGISAQGYFEISTDSIFQEPLQTEILDATSNNDFIIRKLISGLKPDQKYYYRVIALVQGSSGYLSSSTGTFTTLPEPGAPASVRFITSTGFNYEKFYGIDKPATEVASEQDQLLGFEAFEAVKQLKPDFFVANGDVVYYDKPGNEDSEYYAKTRAQMQAKWHRYFAMPRNREMMLQVPVFYLKDDHDYRYNDCDTTDQKKELPTHQDGVAVFREQTPVVDLKDPDDKTYRTVRAGKLLQVWLVEGRDYRSPNLMEDGPDKTLWGAEQFAWLKQSLLESDATFKILLSPTPLIGPDDAYKKDNHANFGGFQHERQLFFDWLKEHDFLNKNFYLMCGDRHWQYHSIHPDGFEEFSSGAFVDQNSRAGRLPGDPKSTDPDAILTVPYIQTEGTNSGGFLKVEVSQEDGEPIISFTYYNTRGRQLHNVTKKAANNS